MKERIRPRRSLKCRNRKTGLLLPFSPPCCNYQWILDPPEQCNPSPLLPNREKIFALLSTPPPSTPTVYVPHSIHNWPARPLSHSLYSGYKNGLKTPVQRRFSLELAAILTASPNLINFIFLSFCLMYGNSFPTCTQTMTPTLLYLARISFKTDGETKSYRKKKVKRI